MKIATSLTRLTSLFCLLTLGSSIGSALPNYKEYRRDQLDFELGSSYFFSDANHKEFSGGRSALDGGRRFQVLDVSFATRYMPRKSVAYYAWGNIGNSESKDPVFVRTNSTFTEAGAGFDFQMYSGFFDLIPSLAILAPLNPIDPTSDLVANSEGVLEFHSKLNMQKDFKSWLGYSWLGFNYRGDGRSFLMPWGVGYLDKGTSWSWGAELFGYLSVSDDSDKSATRDLYIDNIQAGSLKFYSRNPALLDSQVFALWSLNKNWSFQGNAGMTLAGANTAAGFHVGGFIRYTFDLSEGYQQPPDSHYMESPVPQTRSRMYENEMSSEGELRTFKEATKDGVNQKIFKPRPTRAPKKRKQNLQKQLDKTEFQIELRRKRKGE